MTILECMCFSLFEKHCETGWLLCDYMGFFLLDKAGKPTDVVLSMEEHKKILAELEELESIRAYDSAATCKGDTILFEQAVAEIVRKRK